MQHNSKYYCRQAPSPWLFCRAKYRPCRRPAAQPPQNWIIKKQNFRHFAVTLQSRSAAGRRPAAGRLAVKKWVGSVQKGEHDILMNLSGWMSQIVSRSRELKKFYVNIFNRKHFRNIFQNFLQSFGGRLAAGSRPPAWPPMATVE